MAKASKNFTIEISSGKLVTVKVTVQGKDDSRLGRTRRAQRRNYRRTWRISSVDIQIPDCDDSNCSLSQNEKDELEKLVDEKINEKSWDFNND